MVRHAVCLEFLIHPCLCLLCIVLIDWKSYNPFTIRWAFFLRMTESFYPFTFLRTVFAEMGGNFFIFRITLNRNFKNNLLFLLSFISKELLHFPIRRKKFFPSNLPITVRWILTERIKIIFLVTILLKKYG